VAPTHLAIAGWGLAMFYNSGYDGTAQIYLKNAHPAALA
jgi:hypothetical protein